MFATQPQPTPLDSDDFAPWQAALVTWLAVGCAALLLVPALRGVDPWFGWLPFWLVVAPAVDLAVLRRRWLVARVRGAADAWRRQQTVRRRQAKPLRARRSLTASRGTWLRATTRPPLQSVMPRRLRSMRRRNSPMMRR